MNAFDTSRWLWDFYSWATVLLVVALIANFSIAQPARRIVIAWSTAWALLALALLTAVPNWSQYSLVASQPPKQVETSDPQIAPNAPPNFEQQPQQRQQQIAFPPPNMAGVESDPRNVVTIDWSAMAMTALFSGSAFVVCWLALGAWQVRCLCASASPAPNEISRLLAELSQGKLPASQLGISPNLPVAVAVGLAKPWILLPQTLTHANREQARTVLAHELAHVANRDLWLLAILRLLSVLLWPHPLFWLLRRQVRLDQELLADAAAAELTNRATYAEQLVALAKSAVESRVPRLASSVGLWERPSQLKQRIALLLDDKLTILRNCSRSWRLGSAGMLAILALALSMVTLAPREAQSRAESETTITEGTGIVSPEKFDELLKQAETKEGFANAVGDLVAAAIRPSELPFISEKRLSAIRGHFVNFVFEHTPDDITPERKAEILAGLRDHAQQHLQLPDKPYTRHSDLNNAYLSIRDRDKTLKWELWMALTREPLDDAEIASLESQRNWMRETIKNQTKHPNFTHEKILADLDTKFTDPLYVIFDRPMSDEAFAEFQSEIGSWLAQKTDPKSTQKAYRDEESGLFRPLNSQLPYMVHHLLIEALYAQYRDERGQFKYPQFDNDEINGYGASGSYITLHFASSKPQQGNMLSLDSVETRGGAIDADKGFFADPSSTDQGDLAYQSHDMQLMALNEAKLLQLDALNWIEADAVPTDELKRKLQEVGKDQVSLPAFKARRRDQFIEGYQQGRVDWPFKGAQNLEEALTLWEAIGAGEGPYVAILTKNGNLAVVQVRYVSGERNPDSIDVRTRVRTKTVTDETAGEINAQAKVVTQVAGKPNLPGDKVPTASDKFRKMKVRIADEEGNPLDGAKLYIGIWYFKGYQGEKMPKSYTADSQGIVDLKLPRRLEILRLWPSKPGFVPEFTNFGNGLHEEGNLLPENYEFRLAKGTSLGGKIVDENGKPVAGVKVDVTVQRAEPLWDANPEPMISTWLTDADFQDGSAVTDKAGKWQINNAPAPTDVTDYEFQLRITHPSFASDSKFGELQSQQKITTAALRDKTARIVLSRGKQVKGVVVDAEGKPVTNGYAVWGYNPHTSDTKQFEARLDSSGKFVTKPLPPGEHTFKVIADGQMPESRTVNVEGSMPYLRFELKPGKRLIVKVVDPDGKPIPHAYFHAGSWSNVEPEFDGSQHSVLHSRIPKNANADGIFTWNGAPSDPVTFQVSARDFASKKVSLTATGGEHTVELSPALVVFGKVTDAETGKAVETFNAVPMYLGGGIGLATDWKPGTVTGQAGRYEIRLDTIGDYLTDFKLRFEAKGYLAQISEKTFNLADGRVEYDVVLKPMKKASKKENDQASSENWYIRPALQSKTVSMDYSFRLPHQRNASYEDAIFSGE